MEPLGWLVAIVAFGVAAFGLLRLRRIRREVRQAVGRLNSVNGVEGSDLGTTAEQAAAEAHVQAGENATLSGALDRAPVGVVIVDDEGDVVYANSAADAFVGGRHGNAVAERRIGEVAAHVTATGSGATDELDLYSPRRRRLRLQAVPLREGGQEVVVFVEDVTEQRRIEAIRRDFVANVSHELKTPLGALSVLAETLDDTDDPELRRRLSMRLMDQATRMSALVDDILNLSHVESGTTSSQPLFVNDVLREAAGAVALTAAAASVAVEVKEADPSLRVAGDRRQRASAVTNLLDNAIKYSRWDGDGPAAEPVVVEGFEDAGKAVIRVSDQGIGIPEAHKERIFERFYRVDPARSRATGGTGLGLAIVRHVVLNHNGDIGVESAPGGGSIFTIVLPAWAEESPQ